MSGLLLDTHVVVWLAVEPERIPGPLRASLVRAQRLFVSAASAFELSQKYRLGKLPGAEAILARWDELLEAMRAEELPLSAAEVIRAGSKPWEHRDPSDRMLVAQAQLSGLRLVTKDSTIAAHPGASCIPWE